MPHWYPSLVAFLFGTALGSFANVVVYRLPRGLAVASPRSACPECGSKIAWYDNIPLLSYLLLGGRCRRCRARISARYPIIEATVGILWVLVTRRIGLEPELPAFLAFASVLVILSAIDLEHQRLPNRVMYPAAVVGVALLAGATVATGDWRQLGVAGLGALAYGLPMLALGLALPAGMGGGDIKLAGYLGFHLGWIGLMHVVVGALLGFILGGTVGGGFLVTGRKGRKDPIPFGPFMAAGAIISVVAGREIISFWIG